jgi:hypothetical protein
MHFGVCNATTIIESLMETVLLGLTYDVCLVYLDDVIIIGRTFQKHLLNLRKVFQRIRETTRQSVNFKERSKVPRSYCLTRGYIYRPWKIVSCPRMANLKE